MNRLISKIGAAIVTLTVFLFAMFMIVDFPFSSYLVCMFLPIGYIMMAAGFHHESAEEQRVSANIGMIFSAIYAVLIFLVYFPNLVKIISLFYHNFTNLAAIRSSQMEKGVPFWILKIFISVLATAFSTEAVKS